MAMLLTEMSRSFCSNGGGTAFGEVYGTYADSNGTKTKVDLLVYPLYGMPQPASSALEPLTAGPPRRESCFVGRLA